MENLSRVYLLNGASAHKQTHGKNLNFLRLKDGEAFELIDRMKKRQIVVRKEGSRRRSSASMVRYAECQKNHAASLGGYAVDGCREFMASAEEGTVGALMCAACGCHRNFHRKEVESSTSEVVSESSS
ncbi:hypothetical protein ACH5RR_007702 [Cinchona calisaya]|uniref:ZF-HD dimerization-type domain-containing protein n=1 Tax=Cinchona calisaya TaxID=153742 RepID=A0ABD3A999_9GENT